jgi:hypothetical protein
MRGPGGTSPSGPLCFRGEAPGVFGGTSGEPDT